MGKRTSQREAVAAEYTPMLAAREKVTIAQSRGVLKVTLGRRKVELSKITDKDLLRVPLSEMVKIVGSFPPILGAQAFGRPMSGKQLLEMVAGQSALKRRASLEIQNTLRRVLLKVDPPKVDLFVSETAKEIDRVLGEIIPSMVRAIEGEIGLVRIRTRMPTQPVTPSNAPPPSKVASEIVEMVSEAKAKAVSDLLRQPDMLSSAEFAAKLDVSRQQLNEWRKIGKVLAIEGEKRGFRYPAWQLDKDGMVFRGVVEVLAAFDGRHLAAYRFLTSPLETLNGKAPLTSLGKRERGRMLELVQSVQRGNFF
jgi:hypothetical protein